MKGHAFFILLVSQLLIAEPRPPHSEDGKDVRPSGSALRGWEYCDRVFHVGGENARMLNQDEVGDWTVGVKFVNNGWYWMMKHPTQGWINPYRYVRGWQLRRNSPEEQNTWFEGRINPTTRQMEWVATSFDTSVFPGTRQARPVTANFSC